MLLVSSEEAEFRIVFSSAAAYERHEGGYARENLYAFHEEILPSFSGGTHLY